MSRSSGIDASGDGALELAMRASSIHLERPRNDKDIATITQGPTSDDDSEELSEILIATSSTHDDIRGMRRMGKSQQLNRTFRQLSITSFVCLATATWEIGLSVISPGLTNGGRAGLVWSMLWCWVGFAPIYLSMAEMASMAPIAGAQYHWVSEFAPESSQKFLSYITGWVSTVAWQAGNAMGIFLSGSLIQTIILVNNEKYAFPAWHGTLLAIVCQLMAYVINVYGSRALPRWQNAFFALHVLAYFAYIIPIWVSAPKTSHSEVWTSFQNDGGWPNMILAVLVGQLTGIAAEVGIDTTAHTSEEVNNASKVIPRTIIAVYIINFVLLFPAVVTVCYHIPDLDAALGDLTTYPAIYVLRQSMPNVGITVILTVIVVLLCASNIDYFAAVTRDLFAFARDNGMPYSPWLGAIHPEKHLPVHAGQLSSVIGALLSLIYIGSPTAFYAITSLSTVSLLMCYTLSVGSVLWRRIYLPETLPRAQFRLGRWGILCNSLAVMFGSWSFFWSFWPQAAPVTAEGFNWASPIFATVVIFSLVYYWWKAKNVYVGPVKDVEGR